MISSMLETGQDTNIQTDIHSYIILHNMNLNRELWETNMMRRNKWRNVPLTELEGKLETDLTDHTVTVTTLTLGLSPYSSFTDWGASARPLTLSLSAVFKNAGSWSYKYIHQVKVGSHVDAFCHYLRNIHLSGIHELKDRGQMLQFFCNNYWKHMKSYSTLTTWKGTSLRMMMGCLAGFSSSRALK